MIQLYAEQETIKYRLLEPHVRERMNRKEKRHLQDCLAVIHDDHLHVRMN
jgi:hypothetical protein